MPGHSYSGPLQPLSADEVVLRDNLKIHVSTLAGEIGERSIDRYENLNRSVEYIETVLRGYGYQVAGHEYKARGKTVKNIEVETDGGKLPGETVVVGAHYDSIGPGANDNASGVAGLLEIARLLKAKHLDRKVRVVAFVNEEPPFFHTEEMGSRVYAKWLREGSEKVVGMISLETIGYFSDAKGSQVYPLPFSLFYPKTANFIGFVGNVSSRSLVRRAVKTFRETTQFPSEGIAAPGWMTGIDWSDHWSFWQEGYPALMVTDTALFRYKHYHTSEDTPDKLDYDRMARVVSGLVSVVVNLASANQK